MPSRARPTKHAFDKLAIALPDVSKRLSDVDHPVVSKAHSTIEAISSGGGKRITSVIDRVVFKVKTDDWRAALLDIRGQVSEAESALINEAATPWWLGDVGHRKDDSGQSDFYARLKARAYASGKKTCNTEFLLPVEWDMKRLIAEMAYNANQVLKDTVREMTAVSMQTSSPIEFTIGSTNLRLRVRMLEDGIVYLAVGVVGMADPNFFAIVLTSFPGISRDDWSPEPRGNMNIDPEPGEILWSTILSPESQAAILNFAPPA